MSECHCVILRRAARKTTAIYDEALEPVGINIAQFSLLRRIRRAEGISLTELAKRTELDRSTIGRNTKLLAKRGLIAAKPGDDQREACLVLTADGHTLLDEATPLWQRAQDDIEGLLGGKDGVKALETLLKDL